MERADITIEVVMEMARLQTITEGEILSEGTERYDWYDSVKTNNKSDDGGKIWMLVKM